jgi:hypothetical protein
MECKNCKKIDKIYYDKISNDRSGWEAFCAVRNANRYGHIKMTIGENDDDGEYMGSVFCKECGSFCFNF